MHKMYESVWKCAGRIGEKCPFRNKSWFLFLNTCIWIVIGLVLTAIILVIAANVDDNFDRLLWEAVGTGYIATVFGFGGGVMYILRNTTPEEIE